MNGEWEPLPFLLFAELLLLGEVLFALLCKNDNGEDLLLFGSGDFDSEALLNIKFLKLLSLVFDSLSSLFSSVLPKSHGLLDGLILYESWINSIMKINI